MSEKIIRGINLGKKKRGTFIKAICAYMFENEETKFENKTIQGYFNLVMLAYFPYFLYTELFPA